MKKQGQMRPCFYFDASMRAKTLTEMTPDKTNPNIGLPYPVI
jgi:hypothetical protein